MSSHDETRVCTDPAYRESVFAHMAGTYGVTVTGYTQTFLGLLNMKWTVSSADGPRFVKCYHPKRYNLSDPDLNRQVERSLSVQHDLHLRGGICPDVYSARGRHLQQSPEGYYYAVMQPAEGAPPKAGEVGATRMYRLGRATGQMHTLLQTLPAEGTSWKPSHAGLSGKWQANREAALASAESHPAVIRAIERQGDILQTLDPAMFDGLEPGWAHWDFWVDNFLFDADDHVQVIDFDTVQYSYPEIDTARALLSGAWHEGALQREAAAAFLAGYREQHDFPAGRLPVALKLLWCREAHWWLRASMLTHASIPPKRFAEELIWLTEQWDRLDELLGDW
jgi:homoserine kinase type II